MKTQPVLDPDVVAFRHVCPWRAGPWRDLGCKAGLEDKSHG